MRPRDDHGIVFEGYLIPSEAQQGYHATWAFEPTITEAFLPLEIARDDKESIDRYKQAQAKEARRYLLAQNDGEDAPIVEFLAESRMIGF